MRMALILVLLATPAWADEPGRVSFGPMVSGSAKDAFIGASVGLELHAR